MLTIPGAAITAADVKDKKHQRALRPKALMPYVSDISPAGTNAMGNWGSTKDGAGFTGSSEELLVETRQVIGSQVETYWWLLLRRLGIQFVAQWAPDERYPFTLDFLLAGPPQAAVAVECKGESSSGKVTAEALAEARASGLLLPYPLLMVGNKCPLELNRRYPEHIGVLWDPMTDRCQFVTADYCADCDSLRFKAEHEDSLRPCGHPATCTPGATDAMGELFSGFRQKVRDIVKKDTDEQL